MHGIRHTHTHIHARYFGLWNRTHLATWFVNFTPCNYLFISHAYSRYVWTMSGCGTYYDASHFAVAAENHVCMRFVRRLLSHSRHRIQQPTRLRLWTSYCNRIPAKADNRNHSRLVFFFMKVGAWTRKCHRWKVHNDRWWINANEQMWKLWIIDKKKLNSRLC